MKRRTSNTKHPTPNVEWVVKQGASDDGNGWMGYRRSEWEIMNALRAAIVGRVLGSKPDKMTINIFKKLSPVYGCRRLDYEVR